MPLSVRGVSRKPGAEIAARRALAANPASAVASSARCRRRVKAGEVPAPTDAAVLRVDAQIDKR